MGSGSSRKQLSRGWAPPAHAGRFADAHAQQRARPTFFGAAGHCLRAAACRCHHARHANGRFHPLAQARRTGSRCLPPRTQCLGLATRRCGGVPPGRRPHRPAALPRALRSAVAHPVGHGARMARRLGGRPLHRPRPARPLEAQRRGRARPVALHRPRPRLSRPPPTCCSCAAWALRRARARMRLPHGSISMAVAGSVS